MPAPFDRCVKHVKGRGGVDNPYAVCRASMGTDKDIQERHSRKGKRKGKRGRRR